MPYGNQRLERGDIPRGGFLGAIGHVLGGAALGLITGGPLGGIKGAIAGTVSGVRSGIQERGGLAGGAMPIASLPPPSQTPDELVRQHQINVHRKQAAVVAAGGQARPGGAPGGLGGMMGAMGAGVDRRHFTKSGMPRRIKQNGEPYKIPRMQVTNTRALRRAVRRAGGFAKLAMKTIHLIHPKKRGRFGGFKKARRR